MAPGEVHEGGLSVRDQVERYRSAFIAVLTMVVIAAVTGGYILAHENLKVPSWVPVFGQSFFVLKANMQTAQALEAGQGQAVTIAGAKIGEIGGVELHQGVAQVTMKLEPKYARIYRNATLLMRPKTNLQDMTVEVNPGNPSAGRLQSGATLPESQTAPNIDFDEFLAGLDAETRGYLQELLAGAGEGLKGNGKPLAATLKRFAPLARLVEEIAEQLEIRHENTARAIHNFSLLSVAVGSKDKQIAELVDASNAVFAVFAKEEQSVESLVHLLPGALAKSKNGFGKFATAAGVLGPTLHKLEPFARALGPANAASQKMYEAVTPVIKNEVRPFAREILPVINDLKPDTQELGEAFPKFSETFGVLNEFFNELAYNPGPNQAGFIFFLDWANHNLNSVVSSADAHGALGRSLTYLNCNVAPLLAPIATINPTVNLLVGLLNPPNKAACQAAGILNGKATASAAHFAPKATPDNPGGLFGGLGGGKLSQLEAEQGSTTATAGTGG